MHPAAALPGLGRGRLLLFLASPLTLAAAAFAYVAPAPVFAAPTDPAPATCGAANPASVTYTVKSGDTLYGIAANLGVGDEDGWIAKVVSLNSLNDPDSVREGLALSLPPNAPPDPAKGATPYTIKNGDTLSAIADNLGIDSASAPCWMAQVVSLNKLAGVDSLHRRPINQPSTGPRRHLSRREPGILVDRARIRRRPGRTPEERPRLHHRHRRYPLWHRREAWRPFLPAGCLGRRRSQPQPAARRRPPDSGPNPHRPGPRFIRPCEHPRRHSGHPLTGCRRRSRSDSRCIGILGPCADDGHRLGCQCRLGGKFSPDHQCLHRGCKHTCYGIGFVESRLSPGRQLLHSQNWRYPEGHRSEAGRARRQAGLCNRRSRGHQRHLSHRSSHRRWHQIP